MKKLSIVLVLILVVAGLTSAQAAKGGTYYVSVKNVTLKSSSGLLASNSGQLAYGDKVTVLQVDGKFVEVQSAANSSIKGWTASANLSAKQVVSGTTSTTTAKEVALAGKGFNQEIEKSYKNQQHELNYADVDRMELVTISDTELRRFLEEGRLALGDN